MDGILIKKKSFEEKKLKRFIQNKVFKPLKPKYLILRICKKLYQIQTSMIL